MFNFLIFENGIGVEFITMCNADLATIYRFGSDVTIKNWRDFIRAMKDGGDLEFLSKENQIMNIIDTKLEIKDKKVTITNNLVICGFEKNMKTSFNKTPLLLPEELEDFSHQLSKIYQIQSHFF